MGLGKIVALKYFNSRPRVGGDYKWRLSNFRCLGNFNSRPRVGGDHPSLPPPLSFGKFQFPPRVGGDSKIAYINMQNLQQFA